MGSFLILSRKYELTHASKETPESRGNSLAILVVLFIVLVCAVVGARLWARFYIIKRPGWDDFLTAIALPLLIALDVLILLRVFFVGKTDPGSYLLTYSTQSTIRITWTVTSGIFLQKPLLHRLLCVISPYAAR